MHLVEALIEAVTGNNWHNCSWNGRTGRFCQENGPSTCATYSGDRTSEVYFAGQDNKEGHEKEHGNFCLKHSLKRDGRECERGRDPSLPLLFGICL